jgi:transaldolase
MTCKERAWEARHNAASRSIDLGFVSPMARAPIGRSRFRLAAERTDAILQAMKPTAKLHRAGQSLWLDNISREMLDSGRLQRYIDEYTLSGLTSNPSIFDKAIASGAYDAAIRHKAAEDPEELFFELAIEDLRRAADLFGPIHRRTCGVDGWVSLEVSPLLAYDASRTVQAAADLHAQAGRENLFIKIPGTQAGLAAIEESTFAGVPVNVTLLFSREQYLAAADAYMRGIERRIAAGLNPDVNSIASVFVSRWDAAVLHRVPDALRSRLGIAIGLKAYQAYRELMDSDRWQRLANEGARVQRLLWASTSTKDPESPDTLYVRCLSAPHTVNTIPESTLAAFQDHGEVDALMPTDGGDADTTLAEFEAAGVDVAALGAKLQSDGAKSFTDSWNDLLTRIDDQVAAVRA